MSTNWRAERRRLDKDTEFIIYRMFGKLKKTIVDVPREFNSFEELDNYIDDGIKRRCLDVNREYFPGVVNGV